MNQLKLATFRKHCRLNSQPVPKVVFSYNYWRNYEVGNNATNGNLSGIQNLKLQSKGRHFFITLLTLFRVGGGLISPPCHVFAYTHVGMRIRVLIFCDFSSFLVWKRLQDFRLNNLSPFSQEK